MPFTPTLRGTDEPILAKQVWRYNNTSGGTYNEEWAGINFSKMSTKFNGVVYLCQQADLEYSNGISQLKITWGGTGNGSSSAGNTSTLEVTTDRWEFPKPTTNKPLFEHPSFVAGMDAWIAYQGPPYVVNDVYRAKFTAAWCNKAENKADFPFASLWNAFSAANPTYGPLMERFYRMYVAGVTTYRDTSYTLLHTTNAPAYWSRNVADDNINSTLSPARFISEVTDPSLWLYPLPGRLQYKAAAAVAAYIAGRPTRTNYQIGWLKDASSESTTQGGRIEIATSYALGQWSTDIYPAVT